MYTVVCGNIGKVFESKYKTPALAAFREYQRLSLTGHGRAAGEPVHLIGPEGDPIRGIHPVRWEVTDTYGGESNYSWVHRGAARTTAQAQRAVRAWIPRARKVADYGDMHEFRNSRYCRVGYIYLF